jgi:hypothetical protein
MGQQLKNALLQAFQRLNAHPDDVNTVISTFPYAEWQPVIAHEHSRKAIEALFNIPNVESKFSLNSLPGSLVGYHGLVST